jgi:hypothetical protein
MNMTKIDLLTEGDKPIVVTLGVAEKLGLFTAVELWQDYLVWKEKVLPTLPEEDQLFTKKVNGYKVWVIEDSSAITVLFPEEY